MSNKLREAVKSLLDLLDDFGINEEIALISHENNTLRESMHTDRTLAVLRKAKAALDDPIRNCDNIHDVNEAYNKFMGYVRRENPSFTKSAPLHTVWDALKWVLGDERRKYEQ